MNNFDLEKNLHEFKTYEERKAYLKGLQDMLHENKKDAEDMFERLLKGLNEKQTR